ncbi:DNA polymerase beta [Amphibalanus amphitrite]|uniref:DNA polymerase n=1 Tax=Amphibalanus amphitrite TaxID=1232801 RepID=A0A6A4WST0_AMPAM|nr:DNA polymerase beta [Amphibalanus amphitrite]
MCADSSSTPSTFSSDSKFSSTSRKAASVLSHHPERITSGEQARQLAGIGRKIADKIDEFLQTGHLRKLDKIRASDVAVATAELSRVSGIGPAKARQLIDGGVRTLEELRARPELLNRHQTLGLRYVTEFESRIPRQEAAAIERHVLHRVAELDGRYRATVCGSYRRGAESSGDVDLLITHPDYTSDGAETGRRRTVDGAETGRGRSAAGSATARGSGRSAGGRLLGAVVDHLSQDGFVTDTLSQGDSKFMGVCRLPGAQYTTHRRLDIRLVPHDQYHCAVLYFTGSDEFNRQMRAHALEQGFTLNEYGLRPLGTTGVAGEPVPVGSEREVFEYLQYPYRPPEQRNL